MSRRRYLLGGLLVAATLAAYVPALVSGFIWDDDSYVTDNPTLKSLEGLRRIWFVPDALPQYYPLVHTTFWVEHHLWGLAPFGYHLVNVLLHALNGLLLFAAIERLSVKGAWLAAFVFALHPVHVESVAWITERKNVLSGAFYLAAGLALLRFYRLSKRGAGGPGAPAAEAGSAARDAQTGAWSWYALGSVLYVCALLSKTVTATLPLALLILLWWKRDRLRWRDVVPLAPLLLLGAGFGAMTAWIEKHHVGANGEIWNLSVVERVLIAGRALWFYAAKLVWPVELIFFYPRWHVDAGVWWQFLYPVSAAAAVIGLWVLRERLGKGPFAAVVFFAVTLIPALGFFDVFPMRYSYVADHFQYLASAGLIALAAACAVKVVGTAADSSPSPDGEPLVSRSRPAVRPAPDRKGRALPGRSALPARLVATFVVLALGALTWSQCRDYKDAETLWRRTIGKNPDAWMAHNNLGILLDQRGETAAAISEWSLAVRQNPDLIEAYNNLGKALAGRGKPDEAAAAFAEAVRREPEFVLAQYNLGRSLFTLEKYDEAIEHLTAALRVQPDFVQARDILAVALHRAGKEDEALAQKAEALRFKAWIRATHEDPALRSAQEAIGFAQSACEITKYSMALPLDALAAAYAEAGRFPEAVAVARQAIEAARSAGSADLARAIEARLRLYEAGRPFRDPSLGRISVDTSAHPPASASP